MATRGSSRRRLALLALGVAAFALAAVAAVDLSGLPSTAEIARLRSGPVSDSAVIRARRREGARNHRPPVRQAYVPWEQISPAVLAAVVASEDARFFEHQGMDMNQIHAAVHDTLAEGRGLRGASTITQQLAKNLYFSSDRSLWRKAKEALVARRLERTLGKRRILTLYLNLAEWGDGVFGVQEASRTVLGKDASEVTLAEAAALAAMLPSPLRLGPSSPKAWREHALHVLDRMGVEGLASEEELAKARSGLDAWLGP